MDEREELENIIRAAQRRLAIVNAERTVERAEHHPRRQTAFAAIAGFGLCAFFGCSLWWLSMTNDQKVNSTAGFIAYAGAFLSMFVLFIPLSQVMHVRSRRKWLESEALVDSIHRSLQTFGEDQGS